MKLQMIHYPENRRMIPPITFNPKPTIVKKWNKKQDSLKVDIKTQSGDINSKIVLVYVPIFKKVFGQGTIEFPFPHE